VNNTRMIGCRKCTSWEGANANTCICMFSFGLDVGLVLWGRPEPQLRLSSGKSCPSSAKWKKSSASITLIPKKMVLFLRRSFNGWIPQFLQYDCTTSPSQKIQLKIFYLLPCSAFLFTNEKLYYRAVTVRTSTDMIDEPKATSMIRAVFSLWIS
jgi:hypothetical protein